MYKKGLVVGILSSLLLSLHVNADESIDTALSGFEESDDVLSGFDDESTYNIDTSIEEDESIFSLSGNVAFKTSLGYLKHQVKAHKNDEVGIEYSGINRAQSSIYLRLDTQLSDDWKFRLSGDAFYDAIYDIYSDNNYNDKTLETYKTQLRLDDTYLQGELSRDADVKIGRQIVLWGKSDTIRITDVINPLDNRLPGLTDIEDLRLSVGMLKLDYYVSAWNISAMIIAENRIFLEAAPRSEFFPVDKVFPIAPEPFIALAEPTTSFDTMQYALAANGVFSGWDLSFYAADVLDQRWHINAQTQKREVTKIKMLGSATNIAIGSYLFKAEIAYLDELRYNSTNEQKSRLDALIGIDYMGFTDTVLSLELANRHIFEYEEQMGAITARPDYVDENEVQTAFRASRSFSNDTMNLSALVTLFGGEFQYGGFARVWLEYELREALHVNVGVVDYIDGDRPFIKAIKDNDRMFGDITYAF